MSNSVKQHHQSNLDPQIVPLAPRAETRPAPTSHAVLIGQAHAALAHAEVLVAHRKPETEVYQYLKDTIHTVRAGFAPDEFCLTFVALHQLLDAYETAAIMQDPDKANLEKQTQQAWELVQKMVQGPEPEPIHESVATVSEPSKPIFVPDPVKSKNQVLVPDPKNQIKS